MTPPLISRRFFKALLLFIVYAFFVFSTFTCAENCLNATCISNSFSQSEQEQLKTDAESHQFQTEVSRLMDIIINSLYTQKEVFLRELISNAADALEKIRFLSVSDSSLLEPKSDLNIQIEVDKDAKTLTIQDSGVGMTKNELVNNLGTIARSGTTNFLEALANGADVNLIGQFGVGFYSAFLVADKVTVISKSNSDPLQHVWESSAGASFTVSADPRNNTLGRGTRIILHLKDDSTEFLDVGKLRNVATKFNQFVSFPILLRVEKEVEEEVPVDEEEVIESEAPDSEKPKTKKLTKTVIEWEHLNKLKPIWLRPKENITETEYNDFYKSLAKDYSDPLSYIHFSAEGEVDFKSILFIPAHPPFDQWSSYFSAKQDAIKMYSRRILVAEEVYELLPKWLNFIKGVVDSDDLPLKVDRESLSQTRMMRVISKKVVAKFIELIRKLSKDDSVDWDRYRNDIKNGVKNVTVPDTKFGKFWNYFGKNLKVGCVEDDSNRDKLVKTFRYHTTKSGLNESITLDQYSSRMPSDQKDIFFIANDNFDAAMSSPHVQIYKNKGWEVLIVDDPLDEPCLQRVGNYDSKPIASVEKTNSKITLTEDEKLRFKKITKAFKPLTDFLTTHLKGKIGRAQVSQKLVEDPVAITTEMYGNSAYGERVMRAQTFSPGKAGSGNRFRRLEINPSHPLIQKLLAMVKTSSDDPQAESLAEILYEAAMLGSGFSVDHPQPLVNKLIRLLQQDAGVPSDAMIQDYELSPEEDALSSDTDDSNTLEEGGSSNINDFDEEKFAKLMEEMKEKNPGADLNLGDEPITGMHDEL